MNKFPTSARKDRIQILLTTFILLFTIVACSPQTSKSFTEAAVSQASTPITQQPTLTHIELSDFYALYLQDYKQSDQFINSKRFSMENQIIRGFFFPELNSKFSQGGPEVVHLLIIDGMYHLLILAENDNNLEYTHLYEKGMPENLIKTEQATILINLETGSVIQDDETDKTKVYNHLKSAKSIVQVPAITGEHDAIFIEQEKPIYYCANKIYRGCHHSIYYNTGYHLGNDKYAFYTSNTSYQPENNKPLYIGFYRYANSDSKALQKTPFLPPETLIINRSVRIKLDQPTVYTDAQHVPADFVGNIHTLWQLDKTRRYLVYFGKQYPFLFLIMDGEKGLNIPENQFKGISFLPYAEVYAKFGQYTDYRKRAEDLSRWIDNRS